MLINLSELFTCEGKKKVYHANCGLSNVEFYGVTYEIIKAEPFDLTVTNTGVRKYFIEGCTTVTVETLCARCLEPVACECHLDLTRELEPLENGEERQEELEEESYLKGYNLDVDQLVYNELLPGLPIRVLCSEDCKGICNRCGMNLNNGTCSCEKNSLDPRMSVIQDIFKKFKEV